MSLPCALPARQLALREALLDSIDKLYRRRACDIPAGFIDDYVTLNWLEWHGGGLRVTTVGENVRRQLIADRPDGVEAVMR